MWFCSRLHPSTENGTRHVVGAQEIFVERVNKQKEAGGAGLDRWTPGVSSSVDRPTEEWELAR